MKSCLVTRIKKTIKAKVLSTSDGKVIIRYPKQLLQSIAVEVAGKIVKQWEVFLMGDTLKIEQVK
ncbi:MAG: hypothetical protein ABFD12_14475 [Syntrophorhabdus sp.]